MSAESIEAAEPEARLRLVRDLVGLANAGGGRFTVGIGRGGKEIGVDEATAEALDSSAVASMVDEFVAPDSVKLEVRRRPAIDGRSVIEIDVAEPDEFPLVLTTAGQVPTETGTEAAGEGGTTGEGEGETPADAPPEVFAAGSVVVHRSGRTHAAALPDFRRWTAAAVERERARLVEHLSMVLHAPAGSRLRLFTDDEVRDDPSYFLARSADLFRQRPERVLDSRDLQYLWLHRDSLATDRTASELLVQSALRKRATLFLWLTVLDLSPAAIKAQLWAALDMRDRDKSDAARSILQVASLVAAEDDYRELHHALATADYAHMRAAAELWPTLGDAREALAATADRGLRTKSDADLLDLADEIVAAGGSTVLRQAPPIGLEVLTRKLERSVRA